MYTIINDKKYNIITCDSFFSRLIGLMFKREKISHIYFFPKCSCIHTFFMKQNIDLCIIDKNNKILFLKSNLSKNNLILKKGYSVLEMPVNTCKFLNTGDIFEFYT